MTEQTEGFIYKTRAPLFTPNPKWHGCVPMSNDERRAQWALRYYACGYHHKSTQARDVIAWNTERKL